MHEAAREGHTGVVVLLLNREADVNARDGGGQTPLCFAVYNEHAEIVELLLDRGADVSARYKGNLTILDYFVDIIKSNREISTDQDWIFRSPQCISMVLKSISEEEATEVIGAILVKGGEGLVAIVANNDNPETQKEILTCVIKQYAILLQSTQIETEQGQQLEEGYRAIITAAVRANPNLYDVANSFCNMVSDLCENIPGNVVDLVGSYLTISPYTLHNGIPTILECIREAMPQQEQTREGSRGWAASISSHDKEARPSR